SLLIGELKDNRSVCQNLFCLGRAYNALGQSRKVIEYCEQSLQISRNKNVPRFYESNNLNTLAIAWRRVGQISKSIEMYEESIKIHREIYGMTNPAVLANLGVAYRYLGLLSKSIEYHDQALSVIHQNIRDSRTEGITLGTQAVNYRYLGQQQKAVEYGHRALEFARNVNDRYWEAYHCAELGASYFDLGDISRGFDFINKATDIAHETADSQYGGVWTVRTAVMELLSKDCSVAFAKLKYAAELTRGIDNSQYNVEYGLARAMIELRDNQLEEAQEALSSILQTEYRIFLPDILATNGIILLRQKKYKEAVEQFSATIALADTLLKQTNQFYSALEVKGVAICGLALCKKTEESPNLSLAIECYRTARNIISAPGAINRALFFFEECAKSDEKSIILGVRNAVEGKE
ncbi:MAG TPA: tetratricopeptide repeat protein, partial [Methanoregulaceae archaeon]|nr:tetratricopeptide repeat protein [Methanoregulaceae archaeon]